MKCLDAASAVYEWSSAAQMIAIRLAEASGDTARDHSPAISLPSAS